MPEAAEMAHGYQLFNETLRQAAGQNAAVEELAPAQPPSFDGGARSTVPAAVDGNAFLREVFDQHLYGSRRYR